MGKTKKSGNVEEYRLALLGHTWESFESLRTERDAAHQELRTKLEDPDFPSVDKHHLQCEFALKYGLHNHSNPTSFIFCPTCWLKPFMCACTQWRSYVPDTRVVVYMHHHEWSRGSSTGIVIKTTLDGCEILLKGHKEHDQRLQEIIDDPENFVAVLWPSATAIEAQELRTQMEEAEKNQHQPPSSRRLVVIAIDSTWKTATNMASRLPSSLCQVKLSPGAKLFADGCSTSLLYPIRAYGGSFEDSGRVSTLEAVAALLRELGESDELCDGLLYNLKVKVDSMLQQKGKPTVYGVLEQAQINNDE